MVDAEQQWASYWYQYRTYAASFEFLVELGMRLLLDDHIISRFEDAIVSYTNARDYFFLRYFDLFVWIVTESRLRSIIDFIKEAGFCREI